MSNENKNWSYNAGERGRNWVRAFEEAKSGILYLEWREECDDGTVKRPRRSLRKTLKATTEEKRRKEAKVLADRAAAQLAKGPACGILAPTVRLGPVLDRYLREQTPRKGKSKQGHDRRCAHMFRTLYGDDQAVMGLNLEHWNHFIDARRTGKVQPPSRVGLSKREAALLAMGQPIVQNRTIELDLKFLWSVLNWGTKISRWDGEVLLPHHPLKKVIDRADWPKRHNPKRPRLTDEQYAAMVELAAHKPWQCGALLTMTHETGHRIGSVRQLLWTHADLKRTQIRWSRETDKMEWEHTTPLTPRAIEVLREAQRRHPGVGKAPVFPSPKDASRPCTKQEADDWWNELQVQLEAQGIIRKGIEQLGWQSIRRKFAHDYRHLPLRELMELGGWRSAETLLRCYMEPTQEDLDRAIADRRCRLEEFQTIA